MQPLGPEFAATPRLVIAAPQGRSGKTTVSLGICAALAGRGLRVQPFKKGPDYIDPSWLSAACQNPCRSLDPFFLPEPETLQRAFLKGALKADISLVEGNHGLYDSLETDGSGSTAAVARALQAPVFLVINAARMSRSAAAMVHGYQTFEPETPIAGVILNQVAQGRHEAKLRQAIEQYCHIPVVGALPRNDSLTIPDRHLGLVPHGETDSLPAMIEACREAAENHIDLSALLEIAQNAPALPVQPAAGDANQRAISETRVQFGVIRDRAFSFYYPENLEALAEEESELVFIDSLQDRHLPTVAGLYIGGGFPEMFLDQLSTNHSLRREIREAVEDGLPVYAECGGLMYLSQAIHWGDKTTEMVGALPIDVEMTNRPQAHGYVKAICSSDNPFFPQGTELRGHEFHHSKIRHLGEDLPTALRLERGTGLGGGVDGLIHRNVLACYTHLHTGGAPAWAKSLVLKARSNLKLQVNV